MDWPQVLTIVGTNVALIGLSIGITISLFIHSDKKNQELIQAIQSDIKNFNEKWMEEQKIFHGRLCAIEERAKVGKKS